MIYSAPSLPPADVAIERPPESGRPQPLPTWSSPSLPPPALPASIEPPSSPSLSSPSQTRVGRDSPAKRRPATPAAGTPSPAPSPTSRSRRPRRRRHRRSSPGGALLAIEARRPRLASAPGRRRRARRRRCRAAPTRRPHRSSRAARRRHVVAAHPTPEPPVARDKADSRAALAARRRRLDPSAARSDAPHAHPRQPHLRRRAHRRSPPRSAAAATAASTSAGAYGEGGSYAVHDGVVERVQRAVNPDHGGRYVRLTHQGGTIATQYFHLSDIPRRIVEGVAVKAGEVVGFVGLTGVKRSEPHLHFTIEVQDPSRPRRALPRSSSRSSRSGRCASRPRATTCASRR